MIPSGANDSRPIVCAFLRLLGRWEKHCGTLCALTDQIVAMERCENDIISVAQEIFTEVKITIQGKIMEELHSLKDILTSMEEQYAAMLSLVNGMAEACQQLLEGSERHTTHLNTLQSLDSTCRIMALATALKRSLLMRVQPHNVLTLYAFTETSPSSVHLQIQLERSAARLENTN